MEIQGKAASVGDISLGVSYLLPVNLPARWLRECLESYTNDHFAPKEIILIFNGCLNVNQEVKLVHEILNGLDFQILELKEKGIANALNAGLEASKYKYIARIDADDIILPERSFKQFSFLEAEKNRNIAVVGGQVIIIDASGRGDKVAWYPTLPKLVASNFLVTTPLAHPATMFRREVVINSGGYDLNTKAEDLSLWVAILKKWEITNLQETVIKYRKHNFQETVINEFDILRDSLFIRQNYLATMIENRAKFGFHDLIAPNFILKLLIRNFGEIERIEINWRNFRKSGKLSFLIAKPSLSLTVYTCIRTFLWILNRVNRAVSGTLH